MKLYGLIGKTLKHSFSKDYFTKKFASEGLTDCAYKNFELEAIEQIEQLLSDHPDIKGLNVTIPYKEAVLPYLHVKNEVVSAIHACNCIRIEGGKLYGFNTDVIGFKESLLKYLQPHHTHALILGTGGAAKAVQYVLDQLHIAYHIVSRQSKNEIISYSDINKQLLEQYTLIINTTPLGMYPDVDALPPIPYEYLSSRHYLYDLIYNPAVTRFLHEGKSKGATVSNGHGMLLLQAEASWDIWNR